MALSTTIVAFFLFEAYRKGDWERPKSILSEFVAVFAAIAIGIWISQLQREVEREETADALLQASVLYINGRIEYLATEQMSVAGSILAQPNIIERFLNSPEVVRRYSAQYDDISTQFRLFERRDRAAVESCGASIRMYSEQTVDVHSQSAVDRWIAHLGEYEIVSEDKFPTKRKYTKAEEAPRIEILMDLHACVLRDLISQVTQAYELYEALCQAGRTVGADTACNWQFISDDAEARRTFLETNPRERYLDYESRFSEGLAANGVVVRYKAHQEELKRRRIQTLSAD